MGRKIIYIILFIFILVPFTTKGQFFNTGNHFTKRLEVNLNTGANQFYGDVQEESNPFKKINDETEIAYGVNAIWKVTPTISLRGQIFYGQLTSIRESRNKYFIADIFAYNLVATFDLSALIAGYNSNRLLSFYALGGVGLSNWQTSLRALDTDNQIAGNGLSGDWTTEITSPIGIGANIRLNNNWYISLENALNYMVNADQDGGGDMLDAEPTGSNNDAYNYFSIGITYSFPIGKVNRGSIRYNSDKFDCVNGIR